MKQLQGRKTVLSSPAAFALAVGLTCWGSAVMAGEPVPGVDVILGKNPGGSIVARGRTDGGGNYQFNNLAPGDYEICIAKQPCKPVKVGPGGTLRGQIPNSGNMGIRKAGDPQIEYKK